MVHHLEEGYLDVLRKDGYEAVPLEEGEMVTVPVPGGFPKRLPKDALERGMIQLMYPRK